MRKGFSAAGTDAWRNAARREAISTNRGMSEEDTGLVGVFKVAVGRLENLHGNAVALPGQFQR